MQRRIFAVAACAALSAAAGCGQESSGGSDGGAAWTCNCGPTEVCCSAFQMCCPSDHPYGCRGGGCFVTPPVCFPNGYEYCGH